LIAIGRQFPKSHGLTRLLGTFPEERRPAIDEDDLDALDPWVIDGRYAADLPPVSSAEAVAIASVAERVVEAVLPFRARTPLVNRLTPAVRLLPLPPVHPTLDPPSPTSTTSSCPS
jgi:hypothetical protein